MGKKSKDFLAKNIVSILFAVMCVGAFFASKASFSYFLQELITRIVRNSVLVLALIIPVITGLGMNFSIVLGAMAAQAGLILITHWHIDGVVGIVLAIVIMTPIAALLGWLMGQLFNRTKGQEMITGMIAGYFANGIYQLIFIVLLGSIIPFKDATMMLSSGVGLNSTVVLRDPLALDKLFTIRCDLFILFVAAIVVILAVIRCVQSLIVGRKDSCRAMTKMQYRVQFVYVIVAAAAAAFCQMNASLLKITRSFFIPASTVIVIVVVTFFTQFITKTKLGQNFRAVGQDMRVATAAGINVNKTRIIAIMLSTVLAGLGQIISLQNIGSFATYSAHDTVATYAIAALLVGGATVKQAKVHNVFLGLLLFHALFIVAPQAGNQIFGNPVYGEYFRVFVSYGVIAMAARVDKNLRGTAWNTSFRAEAPESSMTSLSRFLLFHEAAGMKRKSASICLPLPLNAVCVSGGMIYIMSSSGKMGRMVANAKNRCCLSATQTLCAPKHQIPRMIFCMTPSA